MNQSATQLLLSLLLGSLLMGIFVLLTFRDYREGLILDSNRAYMPGIRIENANVQAAAPIPEATPTPGASP